jgi:uncharacterized protein YuzE
MEQMKIVFDRLGNTLDIWFGNPEDEVISEETGDEIILKKDAKGKTIGIEKLNFIPAGVEEILEIPMKVIVQ